MTRLSISRYVSFLAVWLLAASAARADSPARYEAVFSDGKRIEGDKVFGWGEHPVSPRLDSTALLDAKRPLRWIRDNSLKTWRLGGRCPGYIEFIGGDRLVGRIEGVGADDGPYVPTHLLVVPAERLGERVRKSPEHVRILPGRIERVVFKTSWRRRLDPGNLYYLDGRRVGFDRLRWRGESVVLLLKDGSREVKISEIAEVHLPSTDPWGAYFRELATLSPACRTRLMRLETIGGLIATVSKTRFKTLAFGTDYDDAHYRAQRASYDRQIKQSIARLSEMGKALDLARKNHGAKAAEFQRIQTADRQAREKALSALRQRMAQQRKTDEAKLAEKRRKHEEQLRKSEAELTKRLAGKPAGQRDKQIRDLRTKGARSRVAYKKLLESERLKLQKHRTQQIDNFTKTEPQRIAQLRKPLASEVAALKRKLDSQIANHGNHTRHLSELRRRRASVPSQQGSSSTWSHVVHPVWSLDSLRVPFSSIRMLWSFAPDRVPLSRVRPVAVVSPALMPWRANRNAVGGPLRSGGDEYAWGFSVHAYSELRFPLPKCASAFRSRVGLDRIVGAGGCARARVYVGSTAGNPLYKGPLLIGSKKTVDTGRVALKFPPDGPRHLVLQADVAHDNRPRGSDPLNIRDKLDWLDPRLELDNSALQAQVRLQAGPVISASPGWKLKLDKQGVYTRTSYLHKPAGSGVGRFWTMIQTGAQPLRFSREMTIGPADKWLAVHVSLPDGESPRPDAVTLRVGQRTIQPRKAPVRQRWQDWPAPLLFALDEYRGKKVTLELTQPAGGKPLHWQAVTTSKKLPRAYHFVRILEMAGQSNLQIPRVLGLALLSSRKNDREKLALIEIYRHGGIVNFGSHFRGQSEPEEIHNVLVGEDWRGGDKTFMAFGKAPSIKSLVLVKDSGVSRAAVEKLIALRPDLQVTHLERLRSSLGRTCTFWMYNRTGKEVGIYWVTQGGELSLRDTLDSSGNRKRHFSNVGCRFEAHIGGKPISKFTVMPGRIWEIRP